MSRISSVRGKIASALECTDCDACASISRHRRPRRAHSFARKSPTGPAPTISTSVSRRGSDMMALRHWCVARRSVHDGILRCRRRKSSATGHIATDASAPTRQCAGILKVCGCPCARNTPYAGPFDHRRRTIAPAHRQFAASRLLSSTTGRPPWRQRRRASDNVSEDGSADRWSTAYGRRVPSRVSSPPTGDARHDARSGARTDIERDRSAPEDRSDAVDRCGSADRSTTAARQLSSRVTSVRSNS